MDFGGVFGVKLPVSDLARSRQWYEQVFGFTVALEFPDHEGVVRGVAGSLPGLGDTSISLRENRPVAAALAGYDILHLSVASRDELENWAAKLDRLTVEHSPISDATSHWLLSVVDPDRLKSGCTRGNPTRWMMRRHDLTAVAESLIRARDELVSVFLACRL